MNELNHYQRLGCSPNASYEELKRSYQKLAKETHPDKNSQNSHQNHTFHAIDAAWKILRDETQRKIYDSSLLQQTIDQRAVIYAEIAFDTLQFTDGLTYYPCRCGESFTIIQEDFLDCKEGEEYLLECGECSNNILITK